MNLPRKLFIVASFSWIIHGLTIDQEDFSTLFCQNFVILIIHCCLCAVWRHVPGANDAVDAVDIALGKCKNVCIHNCCFFSFTDKMSISPFSLYYDNDNCNVKRCYLVIEILQHKML